MGRASRIDEGESGVPNGNKRHDSVLLVVLFHDGLTMILIKDLPVPPDSHLHLLRESGNVNFELFEVGVLLERNHTGIGKSFHF